MNEDKLVSALATEQTMHNAWRKRAQEAEAQSEVFRTLLEKWLRTSERFSFIANDTRVALSGSPRRIGTEHQDVKDRLAFEQWFTKTFTAGASQGSVLLAWRAALAWERHNKAEGLS